ncbi:MAG: FtsX-like permease family protein, partial [Chloroflexi bacterium]|nr:FtsX-like permease family protein [Chloroflexota bacterium]
MDSLFGVPLTSIMVGLLLLMGSSFALLAWIGFRNPLLVRMGLRNIQRRRAQTVLIVVGLMLSTLIVSAAFSTGDTVGYSVTNSIYEQLEEVDFLIGFDSAQQADGYSDDTFLDQLRAEFASDPGIDAIGGTLTRQLPVVNAQARLSEPSAMVVGVDPATADSFKGLRDANGDLVSASALSGANVFVTEKLVESIGTAAGGTVTLFYENAPHDFHVLGVIRDTSVTAQGNTMVGGVVMNLAAMRTLIAEPHELSNVVVSLTGGTRGTLDAIDPMQTRLDTFIDAHPEAGASVDFTKQDLVAIGELVGSAFVTIFLVFGLFSMAAGILLVFLIFVMLAAERRSEMGMARAIGMSRLHLTETFIAEGMAYNVGSALVGAVLGLGVAYALIVALRSIFADVGFDVAFHVNPQGFVISYAAGVVVTFATVAFSSWRAANLNIVRAIRDLPEPAPFRTARPSVASLGRAALGALWYVVWIVLVSLWAGATFALFIFALGFYGLPFLALFPAAGLYVFGVRAASRPIAATRGWRRAVYALWWVAFNVFAVITWLLLRSRGWGNR